MGTRQCVSCSVSLSSQFRRKCYQRIRICWAGFLTFKKHIDSLVLHPVPQEGSTTMCDAVKFGL